MQANSADSESHVNGNDQLGLEKVGILLRYGHPILIRIIMIVVS